MNRQGKPWLGTAVMALLVLSACQTGSQPGTDGAAAQSGADPQAVSVEKEVEAPEVFKMTGKGLWDGRPSLGGTWVAHADVTDPERVIIRNLANGKSVTGALFRRERDNPGPSLQVSSDAAESLGMLAGQPAELDVVALRKQEVVVPPAPQPEADAVAMDTAVDAAGGEATAAATPAPAAKKSGGLFGFLRKKPATESPEEVPATEAAPETTVAVAETPVPETATMPEPESAAAPDAPAAKKPGGLFGFLRKKPKTDPAADAPVTGGVTSGEIQQAPLDPVAGAAAAAIDRAEAQSASAAQSPAKLERGYIQVAVFTDEANARTAANKLKSSGLTATIIPETGNQPYWRVVLGPVASVAERDALLARVRSVGFADAFPVTK